MEKTLRVRAFAKINAGLQILGKRPDDYHEIRTIYQTIALHDRLEISLSETREGRLPLNATTRRFPAGQGIWFIAPAKTWASARGLAGQRFGFEIEKVIPLGSGLGGASTNAAATFLGLERLTGDRLDFSARHKLAAALGSDVPLFLLGGRVLGCGRGEEVYPLSDLPSRTCLVIFPGFSVSTADAYREAGLRLTEQAGSRLHW